MLIRRSAMFLAARRPSPIARITVAPPLTISPPAYSSGRLLCICSFTTMVFFRPSSKPGIDLGTSGLGDTPTATITWSHSIVSVSPVAIGLLLPLASGSPSFMISSTAAFTRPSSSARYCLGLWSVRKLMPSSLACFTSSRRAGISVSDLR